MMLGYLMGIASIGSIFTGLLIAEKRPEWIAVGVLWLIAIYLKEGK